MSDLTTHVSGRRFPGLGVCHYCGGAAPENAYGYCSPWCRHAARSAVDAGIVREVPETWRAAARQSASAHAATTPKRKTEATPARMT